MSPFRDSTAPLVVLAMVAVLAFGGGVASSERPPARDRETYVAQAYGDLALSFEPNLGQADPSVGFLARGDGYTVYLTGSGAVFSMSGHPVVMDLGGADADPAVAGRDALPGVVSYFKGSDPSGWLPGIPTYGRVRYQGVYPGIDLVFRGTRQALEYDFVLAPGADPRDIAMRFGGSESLRVDERGDLVIDTPAGEIVHRDPVIYQGVGGSRLEVPGGYRLQGDRVSFAVGSHDPTRPLIIDPVVLAYSTLLGGSLQEEGFAIDVDAAGAAYVTGSTDDATTDFPTTGGAFDTTHNGGKDVFVTKIAPDGASLVYSTFLGGAGTDEGFGIAVDGAGAAFVTGRTASPAFPATGGAFDTSHNGGHDVFVTKVPPSGAGPLAYSTFLGGTEDDAGLEIAVDGTGAAFVTGSTFDSATTDFPTSPGAADTTHNGDRDVFVTKLDPTGAAPLAYSTFLGGSSFDIGSGIAVDATGAAFVAGSTDDDVTDFPTTGGAFDETHNGSTDVFVTKIGPSGVGPVSYSTFIGGAQFDEGFAVAVDGTSSAYVTGETLQATPTFPTTVGAFDTTHNGDYDAYVAKLNAAGTGLVYSTFLGGSAYDFGRGIAVDGTGAAHLTGMTTDATTDFPTTTGAHDETANGGQDAYVTALSPGGNSPLTYSTFLGGSGNDEGQGIAMDGTGGIYAIGSTFDDVTDFPTTVGAFDTTHNGSYDAYVVKLADVPTPAPGPVTGTCKGKTATLTGTDAGETLSGTSGPDVIAALGGNDRINAKGGKDLVCAGAGNDTANGGGGKDRVFGEDGKDRLKGSAGNDRLNGGTGKDTCAGGSGKDRSPACEKEKTVP